MVYSADLPAVDLPRCILGWSSPPPRACEPAPEPRRGLLRDVRVCRCLRSHTTTNISCNFRAEIWGMAKILTWPAQPIKIDWTTHYVWACRLVDWLRDGHFICEISWRKVESDARLVLVLVTENGFIRKASLGTTIGVAVQFAVQQRTSDLVQTQSFVGGPDGSTETCSFLGVDGCPSQPRCFAGGMQVPVGEMGRHSRLGLEGCCCCCERLHGGHFEERGRRR